MNRFTGRPWAPALGGAAIVLVLVGGGALLVARGGDAEPPATTGSAAVEEEAVPTTVAAPVTDGLSWTPVEFPNSGFVMALVATPDGYAGLRHRGMELVLFTSPDGMTWEETPTGITGDAWQEGMAVTPDGGLLVAGNQFDPADHGATGFVAYSADGAAWQRTDLEFPPPRFDDPLAREYPQVMGVAAGPAGAVVVGMVHHDIALEEILAEQVPGFDGPGVGFGYGYSSGPDGSGEVEVTDETGTVVFSATFAELGIDPDLAAAMSGPNEQVLLWHTTDYTTWQRVDDAFPGASHVDSVVATGTGYAAGGGGMEGPGGWTSADGVTWVAATVPGEAYFSRIVAWDGAVYAYADGPDGNSFWRSDDGATWNEVEVGAGAFVASDGLTFSPDRIATGPAGIVAVGSEFSAGPPFDVPPVTIESEGRTLVVTTGESSQSYVVTDAAGTELARIEIDYGTRSEPEHFVADADTFTVLDPATGEPVFSVDQLTMADAFDAAFDQAMAEAGGEPEIWPESVIWHSVDGVTWTRYDAGAIFGAPGYPMAAAVGADGVLVAYSVDVFPGREPTEEEFNQTYEPQIQMWLGRPPG